MQMTFLGSNFEHHLTDEFDAFILGKS